MFWVCSGWDVIVVDNVRKVYQSRRREVVALDGVSLEVPPGTIYGVIGESGAGKSTLIRCINMLERPTSGSVQVDGVDMASLRGAALRQRRRNIGMIFQGFNLVSSRSVAQNVALPLEVAGVPGSHRQRRVAELLDLVGLTERADAWPSRLSGGQKQRVGIARALAASPSILLSDEATSALDPATTISILDLLRRLNRELGLTILLITHEMEVVKRICDRVAIIDAGRFTEQGTVLDLATQPESRIARALFQQPASAPAPGAVRVVVSLIGEDGIESVLVPLARAMPVEIKVAGGSIEQIGEARVSQFHLDLSGSHTDAALDWIQANVPPPVRP